MSRGWGALAKWAPFFDDGGANPATWGPSGGGGGITYDESWLTAGDVAFAANTPTTIVSLVLPAGKWLVHGQFNGSNQAGVTANIAAYLTLTNNGDGSTAIVGQEGQHVPAAPGENGIALSFQRKIELAVGSTVFLVAVSSGACNAWHIGNFLSPVTGLTAIGQIA